MSKTEMPSIRFYGFDNDWEQRKLGDDLVSIHTGTNLLGSITNTGMPLIKMGNIQRGYFDTSKVEFLAENEQPDKADIANYGDFFFNTRNTLELVGKGATWMKNSGEYAFNSNIARFELRNLDTIFFNYLYNTDYMTKQIHARAMGTTSVAAIYPRTLDSVEYLAPCMKEQQKIGAYFKQLDNLITLHQRKFEKLTNVKKSMLEKMFPQNGSSYPEIRFKGFTDPWEQRKLGDVVKEITRNDPESEAPIMMITANNGFIEQSERYAFNNAGESLKKYILLKKGELAYNHGASKLRPYGSCFTLTTAENARIPFVYHCFSAENQNAEFMSIELNGAEIEKQLRKIVSSGARMDGLLNISFDEYTSVSVLLPGTEEQDRIADFFRHLDDLITLHQRDLEKLQSIKKALLEKMFV